MSTELGAWIALGLFALWVMLQEPPGPPPPWVTA